MHIDLGIRGCARVVRVALRRIREKNWWCGRISTLQEEFEFANAVNEALHEECDALETRVLEVESDLMEQRGRAERAEGQNVELRRTSKNLDAQIETVIALLVVEQVKNAMLNGTIGGGEAEEIIE